MGILVSDHDLHEAEKSLLDVHLDVPEILVTLVLQDFCEESHFMIFLGVRLDSVDDRSCPFADQGLESVLLVQVGVHVLFKSLSGDLRVHTLLVELLLLCVHVVNRVLELLERENAVLHLADPGVFVVRLCVDPLGCLRGLCSSWRLVGLDFSIVTNAGSQPSIVCL